MEIGKAIKQVRKSKAITQGALCKKCGISQTSLSQIELGNTQPRKSTITAICKALNVSESLLSIISLSRNDVRPEKREIYDTFFSGVRNILIEIFN